MHWNVSETPNPATYLFVFSRFQLKRWERKKLFFSWGPFCFLQMFSFQAHVFWKLNSSEIFQGLYLSIYLSIYSLIYLFIVQIVLTLAMGSSSTFFLWYTPIIKGGGGCCCWSTALLSDTTKYSKFILSIPWTSPRISHFFKETWFPFFKNNVRK